jgi:uncharacterized protein YceK
MYVARIALLCFIVLINVSACGAMMVLISAKSLLIGRRHVPGRYDWDKSSYNQRWRVHHSLNQLLFTGHGKSSGAFQGLRTSYGISVPSGRRWAETASSMQVINPAA